MKVHVTSEIGHLRAVLVHTPGPELLAVTPRTREDFLYDDIIEAETARREHQRFIAILERFTKVFQVREMVRIGAIELFENLTLVGRETLRETRPVCASAFDSIFD